MDNAELIVELEGKKEEIVSQIEILKGYIKSLNAVIETFTLLLPKEVALNAINKDPDKIWTAREIANELCSTHSIRKLDTSGLEGKTFIQISRSVLNNLLRRRILERIGRGLYQRYPVATGQGIAPVHIGSDKYERWRQKQLEQGLCIKCSRPATSKTLCNYHRHKKRESYQQQKGE